MTPVTPAEFLLNRPWIDLPGAPIADFCRSLNTPSSFDLESKLHQWKRNGVVIFEQVISHDLIDAFRLELEEINADLHKYILPIEVRGAQTWSRALPNKVSNEMGIKFNHLHVSSANAARLSLSKPVMEFLKAILGATVTPMQSLTFLMGSQQPTHIDYPYVNQQRRLPFMAASWIPLEDVHPDSGPLAYFAGAHQPEVSGFFDWGKGDIISKPDTRLRTPGEFARYLDDRMMKAGIQPVVFTPRKGDVLVWHSNLPHQGTLVKDSTRTRKSYVTHYTSIDDYPVKWVPPKSEWQKKVISENGGTVFDYPWSNQAGKLPSWHAYTSTK